MQNMKSIQAVLGGISIKDLDEGKVQKQFPVGTKVLVLGGNNYGYVTLEKAEIIAYPNPEVYPKHIACSVKLESNNERHRVGFGNLIVEV